MKRRHFLQSLSTAGLLLSGFGAGSNRLRGEEGAEAAGKKTRPELRFKEGKFRILQLTDVHLKFDDHKTNLEDSKKTTALMGTLIDQEKPDLVIVTGDLTSDRANTLPGGVADAFERLCNVFSDHKTPFAVTFGNHDYDRNETIYEILGFIQRNPYNLTRSDDETLPGAGNCVITVHSSDGTAPRWNLWLFDSHQYAPEHGGMDWIKEPQIAWYRQRSQAFTRQAGQPIPALAFCHIPIPEYKVVRARPDRIGTMTDEGIGSPELNSGLFTSFVEMKDVQGMFVGHNHDSDFIGDYMKISLGFGRKVGFSSSGQLPRGGRTIILTEDRPVFETYIVEPGKKMFEFTHDVQ